MDMLADETVRDSAARAVRRIGGGTALAAGLLALALWRLVNASPRSKIAVGLAYVAFAFAITAFAGVAAASATAQVRSGRLVFWFFFLPTRSVPLDPTTTFELRKIGRGRVLCIYSGPSSFVPNGSLDQDE